MSEDYVIVPFDREKHGPFVFDSFQRSVRDQWPWQMLSAHTILDDFKHHLASPGACAVVAVDVEDADNLLGWAVGLPDNVLVFAFVKRLLRRVGIGSALVRAAGVDTSKSTAVRYWTRAAQRIAAKGRPLKFEIPEDQHAA